MAHAHPARSESGPEDRGTGRPAPAGSKTGLEEAAIGRALTRMAYFTPTMLPMIAVANIWLFFYTPGIGLLDQIGALFGVGSHNWLGNPDTALLCIIVLTIWKEAGFFIFHAYEGSGYLGSTRGAAG